MEMERSLVRKKSVNSSSDAESFFFVKYKTEILRYKRVLELELKRKF
jgi:hypothetical protein